MQHKAEWMSHPMSLELTLAGLLVKIAHHETTGGAWYHRLYSQQNDVKISVHYFLKLKWENSENDAV